MSKYIIELDENTVKAVQTIGILPHGAIHTHTIDVEDLEELNSDYINEHFGQLQDEAYKRGLQDGKGAIHKGCEGCKYEGGTVERNPCFTCCNSYQNYWTAKKQDDEINVGDEVDWEGDKFVVTRIFKPYNQKEQCDGVDADGCVYAAVLIENLTKTGRRFDVRFVEEK